MPVRNRFRLPRLSPQIRDPKQREFAERIDSVLRRLEGILSNFEAQQVANLQAHGETHEKDGDDEISVAGLSGKLADPQTPETHASRHQNGGNDEINVGGLSGKLADPQTPETHASRHQNGGDDEINVAGLSGELADPQPPKTHASTHQSGGDDEISVQGLSGELADPQTPKTHASTHQNGGDDEINVAGLSGELADPQTPKPHASTHATGQSDPIAPADIGAEPAGAAASAVSAHNADTTGVHGIDDTSAIAYVNAEQEFTEDQTFSGIVSFTGLLTQMVTLALQSINASGGISAATLSAPSVAATNAASVGAGGLAVEGDVSVADELILTRNSGARIIRDDTNDAIVIAGGNGPTSGANIWVFGPDHATTPNLVLIRQGSTEIARIQNGQLILTSGRLQFPASQTQNPSSDANTLDDYKEGTWTPTIQGATTAGDYTVEVQGGTCHYTKIGRVVMVTGVFNVTAITSAGSGNCLIGGLPFTRPDGQVLVGSVGTQNVNLDDDTMHLFIGGSSFNLTSASMYIFQVKDNGGLTILPVTALQVGSQIRLQATYFV